MDRTDNKKNINLYIKNSNSKRLAGILLPVASLDSDEGVGDLGDNAYKFIDIISDIGFKIWQILPLNPLGYGNSPYQPYSSYAGDEIYINLERLYREKLLNESPPKIKIKNKIDYIEVRKYKTKYLKLAYKNFKKNKDFSKFIKNEVIYNYAIFMAFKDINHGKPWNKWENSMRNYMEDKALDLKKYQDNINYHLFVQYIFHKQWLELREYANHKGIRIMGDIPIYVGYDSQDVWEDKKSFLLNKNDNPKFVAGVPPDRFTKKGQRWGNPIYDWKYLEENDFEFWMRRLKYNEKLYDIVRIDHFRAFDTYYCIDSKNKTAMKGKWLEAPGYELLEKIYRQFPNLEIVAEDLGKLRKEVLELRDYFYLKGMIILQFSFESREMTKSSKSRKIFNRKNAIIYTGTHDNKTMRSWYEEVDSKRKKYVNRVLKENKCTQEKLENRILEYLFKMDTDYVIIPLQDILWLDDSARINTPGTVNDKNWSYRFTSMDKLIEKKDFLQNLIIKTGRS